jgi:hypothetical protein
MTTDLLATHVSIVLRAQSEGVTERDDLIRAVLNWHNACGHYWWTANDAAKWVDIALAAIKLKEMKNGNNQV